MPHSARKSPWRRAFCCLGLCTLLLAGCSERPWSDVALLAGGDGEGIGGTGIVDEEGIGGTGIIGVVADFGSIIVNGLKVEIDNQTMVVIDGRRGAIDDLRRGQVVVVEAAGSAASLSAQHIKVRHEVSGPVTEIDPARRELLVLDQKVVLAPDARGLISPAIGDWVAVSGLRAPNGVIYGTRIDRREKGGTVLLYGRYGLENEEPDRPVRVAGATVDGLSAAPDLLGREVWLQGHLVADRLVAAQLTPQNDMPFDGRLKGLSIAGFADRRGGRIRLMGYPVMGLSEAPGQGREDNERPGELVIMEGRWLKGRQMFDVHRVGDRLDARPPDPPGQGKTEKKKKGKSSKKGSAQGAPGSSNNSKASPGKSEDKDNSDRGNGKSDKGGGKSGK